MCDGKARSITDHDIIRSLIRAMKRDITQVRRNMVRCSTIQQPSRSSVVVENNMIGSWLPRRGGAISLSALRTRCWGLLLSDKPKHQASLGSVSLNTACLTTTQIRCLGWRWLWGENAVVRPGCCGMVVGGHQFGRFWKAVGFFVAGSDRGDGWAV